jgi:hypothetical protein
VEENVLHQIFDFAAWQSRQQHSMNERRVELIETAEGIAIAGKYGADQRWFGGFMRNCASD